MNQVQKAALRGEALKNKVLDTALALFSEHGYFNTSVHDIRLAAGVSTGAIYHHFQNKEALAKALYQMLQEQLYIAIKQACFNKTGCLEQGRAIVEKMFALTLEYPRNMQFVLLAQHKDYLPDEAPISSSRPFQAMKKVVMDGMATGEIRQMDAWVAVTAMFGGALRMVNLQLDGELELPLTEYLDEVVECGWRAVKV